MVCECGAATARDHSVEQALTCVRRVNNLMSVLCGVVQALGQRRTVGDGQEGPDPAKRFDRRRVGAPKDDLLAERGELVGDNLQGGKQPRREVCLRGRRRRRKRAAVEHEAERAERVADSLAKR
jgi:hypothetical protein